MFNDLTFFVNNGLFKWCKMIVDSFLTNYSFIGIGIICIPILRKIVNMFRRIF